MRGLRLPSRVLGLARLELQAGLFAEAEVIVSPDEEAIVVPRSAVSRFAGVQKVWIVEAANAKKQTIRTGREDANRVEILEGLEAGAMIVLNASEGHDGPVVPKEAFSDATPVDEPESASVDRVMLRDKA